MGYIARNLSDGEKIVHETKLHWKIFTLPILTLIFAGYLYSIDWLWLWIPRLFLITGSVHLAINLIRYFTNEFVVTTYNLRLRHGIFPRLIIIPLKQIDHIEVPTPYNPIDIALKRGNMICVTGAKEKFVFKSIASPKEFANRANKQLNNPQIETDKDDIQPTLSNDKKELKEHIVKFFQPTLVHLGLMSVDDPNDPLLSSISRSNEIRKQKTLSGKIEYLRQKKSEAENEKDLQKKLHDIRMVLTLCEDMSGPGTCILDKASKTERELFSKVRRSATQNQKDWQDEQYKRKNDEAKAKETELIKENLREILHTRKIELEDKVIVIPTITLILGSTFLDKDLARGNWVEVGEPILEFTREVYGQMRETIFWQDIGPKRETWQSVINSPISGLVAKDRSYFHGETNLIAIIPQKHFKLPSNIGDFLFNEYIDFFLEKWVMDGGLDIFPTVAGQYTNPNEHMQKVREAVKNYQVIEEEIDDEMKSLIELVKAEAKQP